MQKAKIDVWGVGTKLITAYDQPALGAVYKVVAIEDENGQMRNTIKLSSNAEKFQLQVRNKFGALPVVKKENLKVIILPMTALMCQV